MSVLSQLPREERNAGLLTTTRVLWEDQGGLCWYCQKPVESRKATRDHVVPRSKGGSNDKRNLVMAHARCNRLKGHQTTRKLKTIERINALREIAGLCPVTEGDVYGGLPEPTLLVPAEDLDP